MIYVLKHPDEGFAGMCGAVGFQNGRGTTSSKDDADYCVSSNKCKCKIVDKFIPLPIVEKKLQPKPESKPEPELEPQPESKSKTKQKPK